MKTRGEAQVKAPTTLDRLYAVVSVVLLALNELMRGNLSVYGGGAVGAGGGLSPPVLQ